MFRNLLLKKIIFGSLAFFLFFKLNAQKINIHELMQRRDLTLEQMDAIAKKHFEIVGQGQGSGYKQYQRWRYEQQFHLNSDGTFTTKEAESKAYQFAIRQMKASQNSDRAIGPWTELGPKSWTYTSGWNPGVGRLTSVAIHPSDESIIYVSSPGGGIWKSTNAAATWTPLIDNVNSDWMNVYNLCIDPSNVSTIYAGLSSGGVLKSTNAGIDWAATGTGPSTIRKVTVHPSNSNIVFAAANNGLYRSANGGTSWTSVQAGSFQDIEFKPDDANVMYASTSSSSTYRSTDNGVTWTLITLTGSGRTLIGVSPDDPNVVYMVQASGSIFGAFYRSTDAGLTYTTMISGSSGVNNFFGYEPNGSGTTGQATYDMAICVNPSDVNEVHIAGIICWKTTNGGTSFVAETVWSYPNSTGYNHADVHGLEYINNTIYSNSDGGIYKSTDKGDNWTDLSSGLGIRQFYRIACAKTDAERVCGGAQDNGTVMRQTNGTWKDWLGADGMDCIISPTNANIAIGTSQNGSIYKTTNGGSSYSGLTKPANGNWVTPLCMHPTSHDTVYGGWDGVYRSVNGGSAWTKLTTSVSTGNMDCLTVAPSDTRYIYASSGSILFRSSDAGATWSSVTPGGTISSICISPLNPQKVWITTTASSNNVKVSTNFGTTWTNISAGLPGVAARSIVVDSEPTEGLYVGMNVGVYYRDNVNSAWVVHSSALPLVAINEVELQLSSKKVRVGTYGRGVWESPMQDTPTFASAGADVTVTCASPNATLTATGASSYLWSNGATTAAITVSPSSTTTYSVTATYSSGWTSIDNVIVSVDKTAPVANAGTDATVTCTNPNATLLASGGVSYVWNNGASQGASINPSTTTTYTVTVTASNGCTATDDVIISVNKTAPMANAGADITLSVANPTATLTATGGVSYLWSNTQNSASITVNNTSTITYYVTVTGANGCTATDDVTVFYDNTANDTTAPIFTSVPANATINCQNEATIPDQVASASLATATDVSNFTITCIQTSTKGTDNTNCSYFSYTVTNIWTATDVFGNSSTASQVITVVDDTKPTISPVSNITVSSSALNSLIPTASDNCTPTLTVSIIADVTASLTKPACYLNYYKRTRTYQATDICGNTATSSHVIVVADQVSLTCPANLTLNTNSDSKNNYNCATAVNATSGINPIFSDACNLATLKYSISGATVANGSGSIAGLSMNKGISTVTYTAQLLYPVSCSFDISVSDLEKPKITLPANKVAIDACDFPTTLPNVPIVTDNCAGATTLTSSDVIADLSSTCKSKSATLKYTKSLVRTWLATDVAGNTTTISQTFYLRDMTAPTATCKQDITISIGKTNVTVAASTFNLNSSDNCSSILTYQGCLGASCTTFGTNITFPKSLVNTVNQTTATVLLKAIDICNNASTCSANVAIVKVNNLDDGSTNDIISDVNDSRVESVVESETSDVIKQGEMKCFPNPFSEDLNLQFNLTKDVSTVVLKLYDNQGRVVAKLDNSDAYAGFYTVRWNLSHLDAGLYHVCLELDGKCVKTERVVMMR